MSEKLLVYLAGPYTYPDPVRNTHEAIGLATTLYSTGLVVPVIPHLSLLWHLVSPQPVKFWYGYDLHIVARCDALLRWGGESEGADAEERFAKERGIPTFDDGEDLLRWASERLNG